MRRSWRNGGARARRERGPEGPLPMVWLVIIRIGGTSFPSPSGGFCVTGDSGMTAIVREKLKCSRRESKRPRARGKGKEMGGERRSEKKGRVERSFEVAAGSFTFRNEIGVPLALRSTPPVPLWRSFRDTGCCEAPYSVRHRASSS